MLIICIIMPIISIIISTFWKKTIKKNSSFVENKNTTGWTGWKWDEKSLIDFKYKNKIINIIIYLIIMYIWIIIINCTNFKILEIQNRTIPLILNPEIFHAPTKSILVEKSTLFNMWNGEGEINNTNIESLDSETNWSNEYYSDLGLFEQFSLYFTQNMPYIINLGLEGFNISILSLIFFSMPLFFLINTDHLPNSSSSLSYQSSPPFHSFLSPQFFMILNHLNQALNIKWKHAPKERGIAEENFYLEEKGDNQIDKEDQRREEESKSWLWKERGEKMYIYYVNINVIYLLLLLLFLTNDLLLFYITYELLLIPVIILILQYGNIKKIEASIKLLLYTIGGSLFLLLSLIFIYNKYKTFNYEILIYYLNKESFRIQLFLWTGFLISFLIKIPTFPLHLWLPFAHVQAPTIISIILASILLKIGLFAILKFNFSFFYYINIYCSPIIILLILLSIFYSLFLIIRLIDLKQIIAYSSIIHMNLFLLGFYIFNNYGIIGGYLSIISHGLISTNLFFLIGILYDRFHSKLIFYFNSLFTFMPLFSFFLIFNILSNISIPITVSFIGELLILFGLYHFNLLIFILILISIIFASFYNIWMVNRLLFGPVKNLLLSFNDLNLSEFLFLFFFSFFILLLGLCPNLLLNNLYYVNFLII